MGQLGLSCFAPDTKLLQLSRAKAEELYSTVMKGIAQTTGSGAQGIDTTVSIFASCKNTTISSLREPYLVIISSQTLREEKQSHIGSRTVSSTISSAAAKKELGTNWFKCLRGVERSRRSEGERPRAVRVVLVAVEETR